MDALTNQTKKQNTKSELHVQYKLTTASIFKTTGTISCPEFLPTLKFLRSKLILTIWWWDASFISWMAMRCVCVYIYYVCVGVTICSCVWDRDKEEKRERHAEIVHEETANSPRLAARDNNLRNTPQNLMRKILKINTNFSTFYSLSICVHIDCKKCSVASWNRLLK